MGSESSRPTPLGVARARFVDGLPRKAGELRGSIALLTATPAEERPREELRRRLHALYASAQVFQIAPLTGALKDAIGRLDRAREEKRALDGEDLDALATLAATLPLLGQAEPTPDPHGDDDGALALEIPRAPRAPGPRAPAPRRNTLEMVSVPPSSPPPADGARESERPRARAHATTLRGLPTPTGVDAPVRVAGTPLSTLPTTRPAASETARALQTVISVLVVDAAEWQARVRAVLPAERFEVLGAADPEEALRLARSSAPDAVLVDHHVLARNGVDLVKRLRDDPLTDFVPVIALAPVAATVDPIALRERGADEIMTKPFEAPALEETLARLTGTGAPRGALAGLAGEHTIEEVASRIADEVKRGLLDSADRGRDVKVPLGDGAEVLAAAWSAIGRVRAHLAQRSGGRLRFRDDLAPGGPAFLALVDEDDTPEPSSAPVSLRERNAIVVDDDPAVVWFFAGLLREEGMIVEEASDGAEALELARRRRPDLVISDILMPKLDGFALTRELKRDPALADVPVVLLSWKEDFLQRMRELQSGASGYLRKEAGAAQILECVREVLRPRARLEAQLRAGGDVRGRLERIGIVPLVRTVAQHRPDARVTVRDAWNLFELDLRGGDLVDLTRTASDGSFSRGARVVLPLLGATAGRFAIAEAEGPVRASIKQPLDEVLREGARALGAVVDAVSGKGLALAAQLELDEDVLASLVRASPDALRAMVERLQGGKGPRALLMDGSAAPHELESVLIDLARQGAILAVRGPDGEDRIAAAAAARGDTELPLRTPSLVPPRGPLAPPAIAGSAAEQAGDGDEDGPDLSWLPSEESTREIVAQAHRMASEPPPARREPAIETEAESETESEAATETQAETAAESKAESESESEAATEAETETETKPAAPRASEPVAAAPAEPRASEPKTAAPKAKSAPERPIAAPAPRAPAAESGGMGMIGWAFLLGVLVVAGFIGVRSLATEPTASPAARTPPAGEPPASDPLAAPVDDAPAAPSAEAVEAPTAPPAPALRSYGEDLPSIDPALGVEVAADQGVVLVEPQPDGSALRVRIADREVSVTAQPVAVPMPAGVHEIAFVRGDELSFRFVRVEAGHTRRVSAP